MSQTGTTGTDERAVAPVRQDGGPTWTARLLGLQRTVGNRALVGMLGAGLGGLGELASRRDIANAQVATVQRLRIAIAPRYLPHPAPDPGSGDAQPAPVVLDTQTMTRAQLHQLRARFLEI
ncbi:MAG TPA: hypothetical protein VME46_05495, partial [Acidimicrobiales bacterium]|nr:hypothetical protein [Acidimicrobiales bacterium]